ncbi:MAG: response regulator [Planctomycetales bacterium]|nr:response regulator [Planctomycetales bacterium]
METAQKKILIAEDSFALANLLNFLFSNAGFEVSICRSGDAAAKAAQERKFDAILVDQQMPAMTGVEVITSVRANGPNLETPVFLCTAKTHELDTKDLKARLNITDVFHKPFSPKELVQALQSAISDAACC